MYTTSIFMYRLTPASKHALKTLLTRQSKRTFTVAPASDPLELMRANFKKRGMCDESGIRMPEVHLTMSIAFGADDPEKPPNLRTVGIQRISSLGVDFVVKQGSFTATRIGSIPVSLLVQTGRYVYGETAEQWRAEGHCEVLPLTDIVDALPEYTVTHMVAARRLREEFPYFDHSERFVVESNSHLTEIVQQVRQETLDHSELDASIKAFRFSPDRIERMSGSPDHVLWERWEWTRMLSGDCPEGTIPWNEPKPLSAH